MPTPIEWRCSAPDDSVKVLLRRALRSQYRTSSAPAARLAHGRLAYDDVIVVAVEAGEAKVAEQYAKAAGALRLDEEIARLEKDVHFSTTIHMSNDLCEPSSDIRCLLHAFSALLRSLTINLECSVSTIIDFISLSNTLSQLFIACYTNSPLIYHSCITAPSS